MTLLLGWMFSEEGMIMMDKVRSSVQFSRSVMSDSLQPHESQHARPPCPSPTPRVHPSSCPLSQWCHPSISSCCPLLLLPSIFPSIGVFSNETALQIRWPKYWSFSFNNSPSNEHSGLIFRMDWLDLLAVQGTLKRLLQHHSLKASILLRSVFFIVQLSHPYMTTRKATALTRWTFVDKVMFLLFNMLSRLVITFLPRSKRLLISWLQSPSAVILEPPKIKSATFSTVSLSICHEVMGPDAVILVFWMLSFKPTCSLSSFTFIKRLFSSSSLSAIRVVSSAYWGYWYFSQQSWFQLVLPPAQRFLWCTLHMSQVSIAQITHLTLKVQVPIEETVQVLSPGPWIVFHLRVDTVVWLRVHNKKCGLNPGAITRSGRVVVLATGPLPFETVEKTKALI